MQRTFLLITAWLLLSLAAATRAEVPNQSQAELQKGASHIVIGKVQAIYTHEEQTDEWRKIAGVVEIAVTKTEKGDGIEPGELVYARFWNQRWIGRGAAPPHASGHGTPAPGDEVRVYLDRKNGGYEARLPNGIQTLAKEKPATKR